MTDTESLLLPRWLTGSSLVSPCFCCHLVSGLSPVPCRLPQPCTVRHLVESFLDISSVPRRSFFELLSTFATNDLERDKLLEFSSAGGQDELLAYCQRPRRTALEVTAPRGP